MLVDYLFKLEDVQMRLDIPAIVFACETLHKIVWSGGRLLIAGNGGSASTAEHMVVDLLKHARVQAHALTGPSSVITAYANDLAYEDIFAKQVERLGHYGDALVLFSASGRSPNVVRAAQRAHELGLEVVAITGGREHLKTNALIHVADQVVIVPTDDVQHIEDVSLSLVHIFVNAIRNEDGVPRMGCVTPETRLLRG